MYMVVVDPGAERACGLWDAQLCLENRQVEEQRAEPVRERWR